MYKNQLSGNKLNISTVRLNNPTTVQNKKDVSLVVKINQKSHENHIT